MNTSIHANGLARLQRRSFHDSGLPWLHKAGLHIRDEPKEPVDRSGAGFITLQGNLCRPVSSWFLNCAEALEASKAAATANSIPWRSL